MNRGRADHRLGVVGKYRFYRAKQAIDEGVGANKKALKRGGTGQRIAKGAQQTRLPCYSDRMKQEPTKDTAWTARHVQIIETASPEVAAEKLGRTVEAVLARRLALGLPDPMSNRERRAGPQRTQLRPKNAARAEASHHWRSNACN